ncbi:hypothetical protein COHA_005432 [Chlorella ohadii]|uniref:Uncharacterized protein n=1 Tax=Chlorella ohadii TaxID=2649997 RepID=A0AAD5H1R5_9CHLO|nr:hypothetical protein COHA_005432 [Chlorella ohadii]
MSSAALRAPGGFAAAAQRRQQPRAAVASRPVALAAQQQQLIAAVAAGPGSGHRHYPEDLHQQYDTQRPGMLKEEQAHHDMMSTEACYKMFPLITHASTPLRVEDHEPAGLSAQRVGDAGPATGRRRRPAPADAPVRGNVLPYPDTHPIDLRRELAVRHTPEAILQSTWQQQLARRRQQES